MKLEGLDHVALAVADIDRSVAWYRDVLGFERQHAGMWDGVPTFVGIGESGLALFPKNDKASEHGWVLHVAFRASRKNFLAAQEELKRHGVPFHIEDHQVSHSIYFTDPDQHKLEITTYELP